MTCLDCKDPFCQVAAYKQAERAARAAMFTRDGAFNARETATEKWETCLRGLQVASADCYRRVHSPDLYPSTSVDPLAEIRAELARVSARLAALEHVLHPNK